MSTLISLNDPDCDGGTCLKFTGFGTNYGDYPPRNVNDRIEVEVLSGDQLGAMPLNEWRYLRFFLLISLATQPPPSGQDIILFQDGFDQDHHRRKLHAWLLGGVRHRASVSQWVSAARTPFFHE